MLPQNDQRYSNPAVFCFNVWQKSKHGGLPANLSLPQSSVRRLEHKSKRLLNIQSASDIVLL